MTNKKRALLMIFYAVFFGCGESEKDEPVVDAPMAAYWDSFPRRLAIQDDLTPCQKASVLAAVAWLEARTSRDLFTPEFVPHSDLAVNGLPPQGTIGVSNGHLSSPEALDDTTQHFDPKVKRMHSADVRLGAICSVQAYAHELGHALGAEHATGFRKLMRLRHAVDADGWELSDAESAAITERAF